METKPKRMQYFSLFRTQKAKDRKMEGIRLEAQTKVLPNSNNQLQRNDLHWLQSMATYIQYCHRKSKISIDSIWLDRNLQF